MSDARDFGNLGHRLATGNLNLSKGGLTNGTTTGTVKTTATINYVIDGEFRTAIAAADNVAITLNPVDPAHTLQGSGAPTQVQAAGTIAWYTVSVDGAGAFYTTKGGDVLTSADAGTTLTTRLVDCPATQTVVGAIKVANTTNPFTIGTTAFGATGVTSTFFDLMHLGASTPT